MVWGEGPGLSTGWPWTSSLLSRPQFPHLKNGCDNSTNLIGALGGLPESLQSTEKGAGHAASAPEASALMVSSQGPGRKGKDR